MGLLLLEQKRFLTTLSKYQPQQTSNLKPNDKPGFVKTNGLQHANPGFLCDNGAKTESSKSVMD